MASPSSERWAALLGSQDASGTEGLSQPAKGGWVPSSGRAQVDGRELPMEGVFAPLSEHASAVDRSRCPFHGCYHKRGLHPIGSDEGQHSSLHRGWMC